MSALSDYQGKYWRCEDLSLVKKDHGKFVDPTNVHISRYILLNSAAYLLKMSQYASKASKWLKSLEERL